MGSPKLTGSSGWASGPCIDRSNLSKQLFKKKQTNSIFPFPIQPVYFVDHAIVPVYTFNTFFPLFDVKLTSSARPSAGIGMPLAANSSATSPPSNGLATTFPAHLQSPERIHQLKHDSSVLALAVNDEFIYAGTHDGEILVWSLGTFQLVQRVQAHKRSVLCLFLSSPTDKDTTKPSSSDDASEPQESRPSSLLFSSAGDAIISVWCPRTLKRLYEIYSSHDVGDVFSVAYSSQNDTVYIGAQNTSIQWVRLNDPEARVLHESAQHPDRRYHRFFDSKAVGGTSTPRRNDDRFSMIPKAQSVLEISQGAIHQFAHFGYVYCMLISRGPTVRVGQDEDVLISGGGDGTIKLWRLAHHAKTTDGSVQTGAEEGIEEIMVLGTDEAESVLSLAIDGSFLYSGKLDGVIELWDLDTKQKLRVIKAHDADVMTLQIRWGLLWSAAANGVATVSLPSTQNRGGVADNLRRNTAPSMTTVTPAPGRTWLATNTAVSAGGLLTMAKFSRRQPHPTRASGFSSPARMTTTYASGA